MEKKIKKTYRTVSWQGNRRKWLLTRFLFLLIILCSTSVFAQNSRNIRGLVVDDQQSPVIGATIVLKDNTKLGTVTNEKGEFSISIPTGKQILVISYIGMEKLEMDISDKDYIKVVMKSNITKLEDVIVVGYGQQKKESVVGAITQTTGKVLERSGGVSSIGEALTGNLPGVITISSQGTPGNEDPKIYIRGLSTWNSTDPLILVDGIERPMNTVDISSVESISVLKDASATAVFGVKGANGVILITTKRGKEGKADIRVTVNNTVKMPSKLASKYDSYDALRIRDLAIERELGISTGSWDQYTPYQELDKYRNPTSQAEAERYPNVDWENEIVKKATTDQNASLNISGGTADVKYFTSVDLLNQTDIIKSYDNAKGYTPGYGFKRLNVRSNLDFNLTKTTQLSVNLAGSYGIKQDAYNQDPWEYRIWQSIYSNPPDVYYAKYSDGSYGYYPPNTVGTINSVLTLSNNGVRRTTTKQINTDYTLKQDLSMILKGLSAKGTLSYDNTFVSVGGIKDNGDVQQKYIDPVTGEATYGHYLGTNQFDWLPTRWNPDGDTTINASTFHKLYYQVQLNYAKKFGKHDVTVMGLVSRENWATGSDFPYLREDWVGRATYNYASKYFAEVNGAYNGSERFSSKNRFAFFPSFALGWLLTEENFMKGITFVNSLKIRASWGQVGSDNISGYSRWLYLTQWGYGGNASLSTTGGSSPYTDWYVKFTGNENLQWEKVTKKNIGVDYSFLKDLFTGSVDFFNDYRTDILLAGTSTTGLAQSIPDYYGATPPAANLGKVKAHGYELTIRANKKLGKNFRVWGDFSMTHAVNKIVEADDAQLLDDYQKKAGKSIGQNYSYVTNGYYNTWDQVYGSTQLTTNDGDKLPGNLNITDYNGDGVIDNKDLVPYKYSETPQNTYNTTIGFEWKNLSLFAQFYGVTNCNRTLVLSSFGGSLDNVYKQGSYWSKDNTNADVPLPRWGSKMDYYSGSNLYVYDGAYLRLKNVEIAYNFVDQSWLKKVRIQSLRIYLNGNNLFLWTKLPDDREVDTGTGNNTAYPMVKRVNLGFNVTF